VIGDVTTAWLPDGIWPLLIVIGLGLVVYVAVRPARDDARGTQADAASAALRRILDDRVARAEVGEQEYRRRRAGLP
jgi:putative membrane protein